ncbi:hypothetical protein [Haladaptatus halobius]|uniref:hypothetical protein n=1 Tax=Haladaptatus halobius TaxID=2884875 RepID=UPI001D0AA702|nr:hypothetical protein [Haladaptatus halobius]
MTLGDTLGLSDPQERLLARVLQLALLGLLLYGLVTFQLGMAVNGGLALGVTLLPAVLRREYGYSMDAGLVLWITLAIFLNSVGILSLYGRFSWYDEVTHTISTTIIAGIGYAVLRAFECHSDEIDVPSAFRAVFIIVFVLAFGVIWEVFEFASTQLSRVLGAQSPVIVYGIDDIVTDMIFNTVGAAIVAIWGTDYFDGFVTFFRQQLRSKSQN